MARLVRIWLGSFCLAGALTASGCGGANTIKFQGTVTLDGKPLDGATVTFFPLADNGRSAAGATDSNGVFRLTTFTPGDGALPGEYRVIVVKTAALELENPARPDESPMDFMKRTRPNFQKMGQQHVAQKESQSKKKGGAVPAAYGHPTKSPLRCTVPFKGELVFDLKNTGGS